MQIKKLLSYLEQIAPPEYQESYDNAGLIVGDASTKITGVMLCLDSTEAILDEAMDLGCNLIIAHHPIVFKGLKRFNGKNYVERVVMKAIKNDLAIYAIHTNLDNVFHQGVNAKIAEKLGLVNTRILVPKQGLKKITTLVPPAHSDQVRNALFEVGAGQVNAFENLSYANLGVASYNGQGGAQVQIELLFPRALERTVIAALQQAHPVASAPYEIISIDNADEMVGSGMIGELEEPIAERAFLEWVKKQMKAGIVRYTKLRNRKVRKVAVCGGTGSFLLKQAKAQQADVLVTADFKYHEFFDAEGQIVIADIGHFESEQFTIELLYEIITNKFSNFAAHCAKVNTNPVNYL